MSDCAGCKRLMRKTNRYRKALREVIAILGPEPIPDCCEGPKTEMAGALAVAEEALQEKP